MPDMLVALYTFGVFRAPANDPANQGFHSRNDRNLQAVEAAEGFVARSGYDGDPGPESWGVQVFPRFYVERGDGWSPATLSLWRDLESPMAFALHRGSWRGAEPRAGVVREACLATVRALVGRAGQCAKLGRGGGET